MLPMLHIRLLGDLRLAYGETALTTVNSPRLQALLAYLILHRGAPQLRAPLAFLLWPDAPEARARANLRKLLHDLRQALPDPDRWLAISPRTVQWRPEAPATIDVADFERLLAAPPTRASLEAAVALYGGDLLPSCYDDWILGERERLRECFAAALAGLLTILEAAHAYAPALGYAQRLIAHDPLQEAAHRRLIALYTRLGDYAAAVRTYHQCAALLERELGVAPSPPTRELYDLLLDRPAAPHPAPVGRPALAGRATELEQLQAAWRRTTLGLHVVLISGDAGIGKTRLAEELGEWAARQGVATAAAACYAGAGGLAYGPLAAWLRAAPLPALDPVWLTELARLLPEILAAQPAIPAPGPLAEAWQRQRLYEALARALVGAGPRVLLLDDLHWADPDTLAWLGFLLRFAPQARLLLVGTYRPAEVGAGHPLAALLAAARRDEQVTELALAPLDAAATAVLATGAARRPLAPAVQAHLFRESEGNPLFVLEFVRADLLDAPAAGAPSLPPTLRVAIEARLAQLAPPAQEVVGLAATLGRAFSFDVLAAAAGTEERALVRALDELWQRRILLEQGADTYYFSHDKLREVAYARLSAAQRRLLHRQVARALDQVHPAEGEAGAGPGPETAAGQIAAHWERAGEPARAIPYYERAAAAARRLYANEAALHYYGRLLALLPPAAQGPVLLQQGQVQQLTGNWAAAEAGFRQALAGPGALADARFVAQVRLDLAGLLWNRSAYAEATAQLEEAQRIYATLGDRAGIGQVFGKRGMISYEQGAYDQALAYYQQWQQIARDMDDRPAASLASGRLALIYEARADYAQARACYEQQIAMATALGDQAILQRALGNLGNLYKLQGEYAQALACYERKLQIATAIGDRRSVGFATGSIGMVHQQQGDHARALACFAEDLQISLMIGDRRNASFTVGNMGQIYTAQGAFGPALACAAHVLQVALELGNRDTFPLALLEMGRAAVGRGAPATGERLFTRTLVLARALQFPRQMSEALLDLGELWLARGRPAAAAPLLDEALEISRKIGYPQVEFAAQVGGLRAQVAAGAITPAVGAARLAALLRAWPGEPEQAALHYERWRLDPSAAGDRDAAASSYRALAARTPNHEYRRRYAELTGEPLPAPSPLPPLPALVAEVPVDIEALLAQVDQVMGSGPAVPPGANAAAGDGAPLCCPACASPAVKKNGHTPAGKQNYRCQVCGRQFLALSPDEPHARRAEVVAAVRAGMSLRQAAQVFHIHRQTIARWVDAP